MGKNTVYQGTSFQLMRELVVISINLHYVKDMIQKNERLIAALMYLNIPYGSATLTTDNLNRRKVSLQNRFTSMVEFELVEKLNKVKDMLIVIPREQAGYRKKEMEQGWAVVPDIYDHNWLLDLRTGQLYEDNYTNAKFFMSNILPLGEVYKYFQIDIKNPLQQKDLRY
jgi:hypothetical protein